MNMPKREKLIFLGALLCLLVSCAAPEAETTPAPTPTPEVTSTPIPTPTPSPTLEETEEIKELWGFPIDDIHDAFEVPTGGRVGTVLVTVEVREENFYFSVWTDDSDEPIQRMTAEGPERLHSYHLLDANFDGYSDFCYSYALAAANARYEVWVWDEEQGQFVGTGQLIGMGLTVDEDTQSLSNWVHDSAASGWWEYYRWENGELICFRKEEYTYPDEDWKQEKVIYERVNGELIEVSREPYEMKG